MPSKAPFSKDFEDAVGLACESAAARQVARQFGLAAGTVRANPRTPTVPRHVLRGTNRIRAADWFGRSFASLPFLNTQSATSQ